MLENPRIYAKDSTLYSILQTRIRALVVVSSIVPALSQLVSSRWLDQHPYNTVLILVHFGFYETL